MWFQMPLLSRFLTKVVHDILPAALASVIGGFLFTHFQLGQPMPAAVSHASAAPAEMMDMLRDEHGLIVNFLNAQLATENGISPTRTAMRGPPPPRRQMLLHSGPLSRLPPQGRRRSGRNRRQRPALPRSACRRRSRWRTCSSMRLLWRRQTKAQNPSRVTTTRPLRNPPASRITWSLSRAASCRRSVVSRHGLERSATGLAARMQIRGLRPT